MFANLKQLFNHKNRDLQKRILFTFIVLFLFKVGTDIIVPTLDKDALGTSNLGFLGLLNVMGGGALERFSIFALGVGPYINASIIVQLLQMDIIPYFSDLAKEGQVGRNKLNKITRIMGIALAFIQGYIVSFAFVNGGTPIDYLGFAVILTAGTALTLWMADRITAKGIGNGVSLIIMAGIISSMPTMFKDAFVSLVNTTSVQGAALGVLLFALFVVVYLLIIVGIVFEETAERRIPIQYSNKSTSSLGQHNYIPFKLNSAGVMPVIFASALVSIPSIIAKFVKKEAFELFVNKWLVQTTPTGLILYILLIFVFAYFYTFMQLKPSELTENLHKNGGYIPGIRPGDETTNYIKKVLRRITLVGSIFLCILAALPILFGMISSMPSSVSIGGTGLLIVVGVALETYKQLDSQLESRNYVKGRRGRK